MFCMPGRKKWTATVVGTNTKNQKLRYSRYSASRIGADCNSVIDYDIDGIWVRDIVERFQTVFLCLSRNCHFCDGAVIILAAWSGRFYAYILLSRTVRRGFRRDYEFGKRFGGGDCQGCVRSCSALRGLVVVVSEKFSSNTGGK